VYLLLLEERYKCSFIVFYLLEFVQFESFGEIINRLSEFFMPDDSILNGFRK
jgi:hypothetical protein